MIASFDRRTGAPLDGVAHLQQSIDDILSTPIGTRLMRRDYGSDLPDLIDQPLHGATLLRVYAAVVGALAKWEPRVQVLSIAPEIDSTPGRLTLAISMIYVATGVAISLSFALSGTSGTDPAAPLPLPVPLPDPNPMPALPTANALPDGAMVQVIDGAWWVETAAGWVGIDTLTRSARLPSAAGLPNGALLQVIDGAWSVETAAGWAPIAGLPGAANLPAALGWQNGTLLQVIGGAWSMVTAS